MIIYLNGFGNNVLTFDDMSKKEEKMKKESKIKSTQRYMIRYGSLRQGKKKFKIYVIY